MMAIKKYHLLIMAVGSLLFLSVLPFACETFSARNDTDLTSHDEAVSWSVPDTTTISSNAEGNLIRYGRDLIVNTSKYLGPKGSVMAISNGMNCQNCHLEAGTQFLGNNYGGVYSTYPVFRARSGTIENIFKRVNDCFQRSLNSRSVLDTDSHELKAIYAYLKWLGQDVPKGQKPSGTGIANLKLLDRPADTANGKTIYLLNCERCHGTKGEGKLNADNIGYEYPPLWGEHSFTTAAGLYRLSRLAGFIRFNMPFDAPYNAPRLTDEEAWDVAAFIVSQPRPEKIFKEDWPDISTKPFDYPFGPYADGFSDLQHKYGPYDGIIKVKNEKGTPKPQ
jgi:thiosulfate dehydrogenase